MPPKRKTPHSKLKYKESCVTALVESLPKQTFSQLLPIYHKSKSCIDKEEKDCNNSDDDNVNNEFQFSPVVLKHYSYHIFPTHPNISISCPFCDKILHPGVQINHYVEHPHARRRFSPMCETCFEMWK